MIRYFESLNTMGKVINDWYVILYPKSGYHKCIPESNPEIRIPKSIMMKSRDTDLGIF